MCGAGSTALLSATLLLVIAYTAPAAGQSDLWNSLGPGGRLPDFSWAGYEGGDRPIPALRPTTNVRDFGALGDGFTDDTDAIEAALADTGFGGCILFPPGRYVVTRTLSLNSSISLKGSGSGSTTLFFPKSLEEVYGNNWPSGISAYAFDKAFVMFSGTPNNKNSDRVANARGFAGRGTNRIQVNTVGNLRPGDWVSVAIDGTRAHADMNQWLNPGCPSCTVWGFLQSMETRIAQIPDSSTLVLERALPWNLSSSFTVARVYRWAPQTQRVGMEGFSLEFPRRQYRGHFKEEGFNALWMQDMANSWIRDIKFVNVDTGIKLVKSSFMTVTNIQFTSSSERAGDGHSVGHHAFFAVACRDIVFTDFNIVGKFEHELTVDMYCRSVVFCNGRGDDISMDNHRGQSYANLFTNINLGRGSRAFVSGGDEKLGLNAGSFTTFWNIYASSSNLLDQLPANYGPALNFVGVAGRPPVGWLSGSWYVESSLGGKPKDLHQAMVQLRRSADGASKLGLAPAS